MVSSLDCRFHAVNSGLQELDSEIPIARFRVPRAEFWNLIACISGALSAKQGERGILREAQDKFTQPFLVSRHNAPPQNVRFSLPFNYGIWSAFE